MKGFSVEGGGRFRIMLAVSISLLIAALGCQPDLPVEQTRLLDSARWDSVGVEIVESIEPLWSAGENWTISAEPLVQIGTIDGEEPYQLTDLGWSVILFDDRVALVDGATREIRIFDIEGQHLSSMGGAGDGPGEFRVVPVLAFNPPDTMVAWDGRGRRFSRFRLDGTLIDDRPLGKAIEERGMRLPAPASARHILGDGTILTRFGGVLGLPRPTVAQVDTFRSELWAIRAWGDSLISFGSHNTGELGHQLTESARNPFFPAEVHTLGTSPPAVYISGAGTSEIRRYSLDGGLKRIMRMARSRPELTREMIEEERSALLAATARADRDVDAKRASFNALSFPDSVPAITDLWAADGGHLWARRWSHPRELSAPWVFDVFDPEGRWLGAVEVSRDVGTIRTIGAEYLVSEWQDEFDVPYLRIYRIERS